MGFAFQVAFDSPTSPPLQKTYLLELRLEGVLSNVLAKFPFWSTRKRASSDFCTLKPESQHPLSEG